MAPVLEFFGGQGAPFRIDGNEVYIGRGAACGVRLEAGDAAERHARLTVDGAGNVFIQDLDTHSGTLRNGNFVYGVQQLSEGDKIEIGGMALVFRAAAPAVSVPPAAAPMRAGADDRTRMPTELPPEVKAALAAREAAAKPAAATRPPAPAKPVVPGPQPPPPVEEAPAGIVVGTPEPEPDNFRTVQMAPPDLAALGIDPATLPPVTKATALPKPPAPQPPAAASMAKRTMMGMPSPVLPPKAPAPPAAAVKPPAPSGLANMATMELQAAKDPVKEQPATAPTMMGAPRPVVSPLAPTPPAPQKAPPARAVPPAQAQPIGTRPMKTVQGMQAPVVSDATPPPPAPPPQTAPSMPVAAAPPAAQPYVGQAQPYAPQPPPLAPAPKPTPVATTPPSQQPYTPPAKGAFGSFSRALAFMSQIFSLAAAHKALLKPLIYDLLITTVLMAGFTVLEFFTPYRFFYAVMGLEAFCLYFVDYACNSLTASLMYDYATTGEASMATAVPRVKKALPGVLTFAAVSALLDVASTYARERNDIASKIILRVLRAIWTTATYVIMPALVIEGVSFGDAFKRSKQLMDHDPTGVGAGIVAMSITSYLVALVCFPLSYVLLRAGAHIHPAVGALLAMLVVNLYWAVSGWMKIAYSTCFYLWARECERTGTTDHALAPQPLRTALDAA